MEVSVLPSTKIPSSTLLVNNSIPDEISTLSAESATKSGTVKTIVDLDTGTEVVVMAAMVAGMGVGTGVMENVATTTITCDEKKTSNSGATVNIPTMTAKTTWTTDPPPAAVMLNGKCSSLVEVRRTECTSAVTGSVAASVSSSEKDFHVVKIQISPTVNNHSKKFESTEQCAKNSKVLITPSDDSSKQSKISVVSFGPSANTSDSTQFLWTVNNNNNNSNINNSSINSDCQSLVTSEKSETICQISPNPENSVQLPKSIVISSSPTTSISPVPVAVNSGKKTTLITGEMVQKPSGDLEVSNPTYLYYMMTSGQCSPSDTLDSGTCSDMENGNLNQSNGARTTPPPLPKKTAPKLKMHLKSTKIIATSQDNDQNNHHNHQKHGTNGNTNGNKHNHHHNRTGSFTDSETSESSLSCDSLNSSEFARSSSLFLQSQSGSPHSPVLTTIAAIAKNGDDRKIAKMSFLPDSLLRDIRDRSKLSIGKEASSNANCTTSAIIASGGDTKRPPQNGFRAKIHVKTSDSLPNAKELRERNTTCVLITQEKDNRSPRTFENDKFYTFHIKERDEENEEECLDVVDSPRMVFKDDDAFAGYKDIHSNTSTIRSSKGTVRGVKNRVRNGIATFLQMQQSNAKNYKEKDSGKVVLYTTSMGIVRETYAKCSNVKQILRTLLVKFEERDVFMSNEYQQEIKERMQSDEIQVPQLFVEAQHIGDAEAVERLNESGELRKMLKPYKSMNSSLTCQTCGGYRLLPCPSCNGSKKSVHRNHFTAEFVALKCMNCDEVGLVKCHNC